MEVELDQLECGNTITDQYSEWTIRGIIEDVGTGERIGVIAIESESPSIRETALDEEDLESFQIPSDGTSGQ